MIDRALATLKREPVRARMYSLLVLVAGYALTQGYLDDATVEFLVAVGGLVLVTESARQQVWPAEKVKGDSLQ